MGRPHLSRFIPLIGGSGWHNQGCKAHESIGATDAPPQSLQPEQRDQATRERRR
jgi:hypothetical protein